MNRISDEHFGGKSFEDQLKDLLGKANLSFFVGPAAPPRDESAGKAGEVSETPGKSVRDAIARFNLKPRDIRDYLDRYVVRQEAAKKALAVAICDHYNRVKACLRDPAAASAEYAKHNIVLIGPTGVGKTYLVRCIARLIGVPFVKADATKFSETGYVGHDVEDLVRDLVRAAEGNAELAQYGIIYLDEIDKIASQGPMVGRDVSGRGVQINLLKLLEETDVSLFSQTDLIGQMQAIFDMQRGKMSPMRTISTRHILFIVSGAFDKLVDIVKRRVTASRIGFAQPPPAARSESDWLRLAQTSDFVEYGFEPEFIGWLPVRIVCEPLAAEDLEQIMLRCEDNVLQQYVAAFREYGIMLEMTPDAIAEVARRAYEEKTGARGLLTVLEHCLRDFKFELPSTGIKNLTVTAETVNDPERACRELLERDQTLRLDALRREERTFAKEFQREYGLAPVLSRAARRLVYDACLARNCSLRQFFHVQFKDVEYGLKLLARNSKTPILKISKRLLTHPGKELSARISRTMKTGETPADSARPLQ